MHIKTIFTLHRISVVSRITMMKAPCKGSSTGEAVPALLCKENEYQVHLCEEFKKFLL
jgi:hypothetical protein